MMLTDIKFVVVGHVSRIGHAQRLLRCWMLICLLMTVTTARTGITDARLNGLLSNLAG